jgi:hypothetical protein
MTEPYEPYDDSLPYQVDEDHTYDDVDDADHPYDDNVDNQEKIDQEDLDNANMFIDGIAVVTNPPGAKAKATSKATSTRGGEYTPTEDLLICKAYIAASEDSIKGVYQKAHQFKATMFNVYTESLQMQEKIEAERINRHNRFVTPTGKGKVYDKRSPTAIHARFKAISAKCFKMFGIEETNDKPSGYTIPGYISLINHIYNDRHKSTLGSAESIRGCYEYLKDKPKWSSFAIAQEATDLKNIAVLSVKRKRRK